MARLNGVSRTFILTNVDLLWQYQPRPYPTIRVDGLRVAPCVGIAPEADLHVLQQNVGNWIDDFISAIKSPDCAFDSYLADHRQTAEVIDFL